MYIYHISQTDVRGYDTYSDVVVAADSVEEAAKIHPCEEWNSKTRKFQVQYIPLDDNNYHTEGWTNNPANVTVRLLGTATDNIRKGVICASFHAG
jgi:hypothetical protein